MFCCLLACMVFGSLFLPLMGSRRAHRGKVATQDAAHGAVTTQNDTDVLSCPQFHYMSPAQSKQRCPEAPPSLMGCPIRMADREAWLQPPPYANVTLPCGFGRRSTFDEVRAYYLQRPNCALVVVTALFGNYDYMRNPKFMDTYPRGWRAGVCFVAFIDSTTAAAPFLATPPNASLYDFWLVADLPFDGALAGYRTAKFPKALAPRLFPRATFTIWHDAKITLKKSPWTIVADVLEADAGPPEAWPLDPEARARHFSTNARWSFGAMAVHGWSSAWYEFRRLRKKNPQWMDALLARYNAEMEELAARGRKPLGTCMKAGAIDSALVVRSNSDPCVEYVSCVWWNEINLEGIPWSHDQIELCYVLDRLRLHPMVHYFGTIMTTNTADQYPHRNQYRKLRVPWLIPKPLYQLPPFTLHYQAGG